jgi:hypothetical protein
MRLVNREFETKVSHYLFRVVVVPFRPEIYGISPEPALYPPPDGLINGALHGSVKLQDKGMKVFQGFGSRISKFAMSFEFDEAKLARPPVKSDQEAITSFWGIYRWPFKRYNRYSQLEGLEQAADETGTMTEALRFVVRAKELGLSIDGGLGWLAGPDINQHVVERGVKLPVFGESIFAPEPDPDLLPKGRKRSKWVRPLFGCIDENQSALERILQEAGYRGDSLEASIRLLLETEQLQLRSTQGELSDSLSAALNWDGRRGTHPQTHSAGDLLTAAEPDGPGSLPTYSDEDENQETLPGIAGDKGRHIKRESYSLKPNDLTSAQREMLLEVEWAQRAFMQSYAIAIIDNRAAFQNIQSLTIARLPSRHLPILRRPDFWNSLPELKSLSLAIIPDWRDVVKLPTSWVEDNRIVPSHAVSGTYQILQEHILHRRNIKMLHFEWLGGGEEAPGMFARNQHILPAPLVSNAMDMVYRDQPAQLLTFPYVEHLSLKNCWITPHIMIRFGSSLRSSALQTLTLNSVSLTAPVPLNAHPNAVGNNGNNAGHAQVIANQAAAHNHFLHLQGGVLGFVGPNPPAPPAPQTTGSTTQNQIPTWLQDPRFGSWAHIINALTPGNTLADMIFARGYGEPPSARSHSSLTTLEFESCGYVHLQLDFDQGVLDPLDHHINVGSALAKRISEIEAVMMKPDDHALGIIVNHIDKLEKDTLEEGFEMVFGWGDSRRALTVEASADGISHPGRGRFSGIIDVRRTSSSYDTAL